VDHVPILYHIFEKTFRKIWFCLRRISLLTAFFRYLRLRVYIKINANVSWHCIIENVKWRISKTSGRKHPRARHRFFHKIVNNGLMAVYTIFPAQSSRWVWQCAPTFYHLLRRKTSRTKTHMAFLTEQGRQKMIIKKLDTGDAYKDGWQNMTAQFWGKTGRAIIFWCFLGRGYILGENLTGDKFLSEKMDGRQKNV